MRRIIIISALFLLSCLAAWQSVFAQEAAKDKSVKSAEERLLTPPAPERQRPGSDPVPSAFPPYIYESIPDIRTSASEFTPVPDRWRMLYAGKWYDPYNQNVLKGDIPIFGDPAEPWFFETSIIADTLVEHLKIPIPVGGQSTRRPNSVDTFGNGRVNVVNQNIFTSFSLINGNTTFKPPDFEFRVSPVFNYNHLNAAENGVLRVDPGFGTERDDAHFGFQELFIDKHITNISDRYDFISSRIGIQQFNADFRGFIYNSNEPGVRIFGNWDNNKWQYNAAWFTRLEKDTNSGLNTAFDMRHEDVAILNIYRQDAPVYGHTLQASIIHRADNVGDNDPHFDSNGILRRPASIGDERAKNVSTTYFGLNGDGHFGRFNTTASAYYAIGSESHNPIAQKQVDIRAGMLAAEVSYDIDWVRLRTSLFYASGDSDPLDGTATGFDAIADSPNFAGGDLSYWQRMSIPFIGGGGVALVNGRSFLPDLKAGKEEGQSNFVNPGIRLVNFGVDFDLTPKLRLITNASYLEFDTVAPLKTLRQDGSFDREIGVDLSAGFLYRPFLNNNVQVRLGASTLLPGDGLNGLFKDESFYDVFTNLILLY